MRAYQVIAERVREIGITKAELARRIGIDDELLMVTMFGKNVSLGFLRLNVVETIERIKKIWNKK